SSSRNALVLAGVSLPARGFLATSTPDHLDRTALSQQLAARIHQPADLCRKLLRGGQRLPTAVGHRSVEGCQIARGPQPEPTVEQATDLPAGNGHQEFGPRRWQPVGLDLGEVDAKRGQDPLGGVFGAVERNGPVALLRPTLDLLAEAVSHLVPLDPSGDSAPDIQRLAEARDRPGDPGLAGPDLRRLGEEHAVDQAQRIETGNRSSNVPWCHRRVVSKPQPLADDITHVLAL